MEQTSECELNAMNECGFVSQVPTDIEIARAQTPKDIEVVAKEVGLSNAEVDLFGKKKAKVSLTTLDRLQDVKNGRYVIVAGEFIAKHFDKVEFL